jgi:hypothetical protein
MNTQDEHLDDLDEEDEVPGKPDPLTKLEKAIFFDDIGPFGGWKSFYPGVIDRIIINDASREKQLFYSHIESSRRQQFLSLVDYIRKLRKQGKSAEVIDNKVREWKSPTTKARYRNSTTTATPTPKKNLFGARSAPVKERSYAQKMTDLNSEVGKPSSVS